MRIFEFCSKTGKVRYRDWTGALIALAALQTSEKPRLEKRAYQCEWCDGGFHLTSQALWGEHEREEG